MNCIENFIKKNSEVFFEVEELEDKLDERSEERQTLLDENKYYDSSVYSQDMRDLVEIEKKLKKTFEKCSALITRLQESKQL